jgi:hypothetical protein
MSRNVPRGASVTIDVTFDFRTDATGPDPDTDSPTLRFYHQLLWSKKLANDEPFDLSLDSGEYLHHRSAVGEFVLSSDSVMQTFEGWQRTAATIAQLDSQEIESFQRIGYTIGGMMVWPKTMIDGAQNMNQARGCRASIADRMDLTLECIRRHYLGRDNKLADVLSRNSNFFALFGDFRGYVQFFLLDDLVNDDGTVKFFMPFDDFKSQSWPSDVDAWREFRRLSIDFIEARNRRIDKRNPFTIP